MHYFPPSPDVRMNEESVPLLDVFVLCVTTYLTYTRFPVNWKCILGSFYIFFITAWAYAEVNGLLQADVSMWLRCLNASLCFVNLLMDSNAAGIQRRLVD